MRKTNKILVTGSEGFIGTHLMKALGGRGFSYDIRLTSRADVNNAEMLKNLILAIKPCAIIHLAAISNRKDVDKNPELALKTNLIGSFNVMRIAHKYGIRVILASSAATYGADLSLYGTTKFCMELLAAMFDNVIIVRLFNVYGKGSKSVINKFTKSIKNGKAVVQYGNTTRDYIFITDVVEVLLSLIEADDPYRVYDVGTGRAITLNKLISMIEKITKKKATVIKKAALSEIQYSKCVNSDWYHTTLEQGIRRIL